MFFFLIVAAVKAGSWLMRISTSNRFFRLGEKLFLIYIHDSCRFFQQNLFFSAIFGSVLQQLKKDKANRPRQG